MLLLLGVLDDVLVKVVEVLAVRQVLVVRVRLRCHLELDLDAAVRVVGALRRRLGGLARQREEQLGRRLAARGLVARPRRYLFIWILP